MSANEYNVFKPDVGRKITHNHYGIVLRFKTALVEHEMLAAMGC